MIIGEGYQVLPTIVYSLFVDEMGGPPTLASAAATILVLCTSILPGPAVVADRSAELRHEPAAPRHRRSGRGRSCGRSSSGYAYGVVGLSLVPAIVVAITSFFEARGPSSTRASVSATIGRSCSTCRARSSAASCSRALRTVLGVGLRNPDRVSVVRRRSAVAAALDSAGDAPVRDPGTVVGIAYIVAFNAPPFVLTGTATILVLAYWVRRLPYSVRAGAAILSQLDPAVEEASVSLGVPPLRTFCPCEPPA